MCTNLPFTTTSFNSSLIIKCSKTFLFLDCRQSVDISYLRGYCTPNQKLTCFVLYLKIINTFLNKLHASYSKLSKELKNSVKISVDQAVLELMIKTIFWHFHAIFEFLQAADSEPSLTPVFLSSTCFRLPGAAQQQSGFLNFTSGSVWKWRLQWRSSGSPMERSVAHGTLIDAPRYASAWKQRKRR